MGVDLLMTPLWEHVTAFDYNIIIKSPPITAHVPFKQFKAVQTTKEKKNPSQQATTYGPPLLR